MLTLAQAQALTQVLKAIGCEKTLIEEYTMNTHIEQTKIHRPYCIIGAEYLG